MRGNDATKTIEVMREHSKIAFVFSDVQFPCILCRTIYGQELGKLRI
jgi:hypothetical protein